MDNHMNCNKNCIANVNGHCAVEVCPGAVAALDVKVADEAAAAELYRMSSQMFGEAFATESPVNGGKNIIAKEELKKCPFCDGIAELEDWRCAYEDGTTIQCTICGACVSESVVGGNHWRERAINKWNRRAAVKHVLARKPYQRHRSLVEGDSEQKDIIWRRFTPIGTAEQMDKLHSLIAEKHLSREDLAVILRAIKLNPDYFLGGR